MRTRITSPLGLTLTDDVTGFAPGAVVEGFKKDDDGELQSVTGLVDPSVGWGVGALATTARELAIFAEALLRGSLFAHTSTVDAMCARFHPLDPTMLDGNPEGTSIALALQRFEVQGTVLVGHRGTALGYDAAAFFDPETGAVTAVTTNTHEAGAAALTAYEIAVHLRNA
ncbi:MAG: serine hydrolase [Polyangiaceae bacterium]